LAAEVKARMSDYPHRRPRLSPEKASAEPIELVDVTGGLDDFAQEPKQVATRIEPPCAPTWHPKIVADGRGADARPAHLSRFDWVGHAHAAVFVSSILLAAIAGILVLRQPAKSTPAIDPLERVAGASPRPAMAALPPAADLAALAAPSVDASVPSEVSPPSRGDFRDTPRSQATDTRPIPGLLAPSAFVGSPVATPAPPARGSAPGDAAVVALAPAAEGMPAVAASSSLAIPPAVTTLGPNAGIATTDVPVDAVARPAGRDFEARAIEDVLGQYRNAFNSLDAGAAVAVWPTVNEKTLARAFADLDAQDMSFESCNIEVDAIRAEAACYGTARYVGKVGSRTPKAEARRWRFILRRAGDGWLIDRIDAR
jgi:hypothetical protein